MLFYYFITYFKMCLLFIKKRFKIKISLNLLNREQDQLTSDACKNQLLENVFREVEHSTNILKLHSTNISPGSNTASKLLSGCPECGKLFRSMYEVSTQQWAATFHILTMSYLRQRTFNQFFYFCDSIFITDSFLINW